ncbi:hypothetical protein ANCDUO_05166 [Ancylostoma duodenale]|uniref:Receptor ligand binding region domain-containing protein n=1 Tax=Ancylostoma duodenale TaxID=51022 RepID=A0A0C2GZ91_9BILA|nr:hypothetical protein ANCDUO_05166 [Ancylostoma duodenale]
MLTLCIWALILRDVCAATYNIGTTATKGSLAYENVRYGVERWNSANAAHTEVSLNIVATELYFAGIEERMCDVMQHSVVAVLIPNSEERLDEVLMKSMCHHFRIPCLTLKMGNRMEFAPDFVTSIGPSRGLGARATSEFLENLRWTSFLLAYQHESDFANDDGPYVLDGVEIGRTCQPLHARDVVGLQPAASDWERLGKEGDSTGRNREFGNL